MRSALLPLLALPVFISSLAHCSSDPTPTPTPPVPPPVVVADSGPNEPPLVPASKIDLLFVVDNSASMADKQAVLASSASALISKLAPTGDLHIGFISSSLGTAGGDVCPDVGRFDDKGHLLTDAKGGGTVAPAGFLSYKAGDDLAKVISDAQKIVIGVDQNGCGLEAQLESAYHFLNEPNPWETVMVEGGVAVLKGTDATLLKQRKAFLRPDSAVGIIMLTDEDDASIDPLSMKKGGWAFGANQFPGSNVFRADGRTTTAPHRSTACDTSLTSPDCTSCFFASNCDAADPSCVALKADQACQTYIGPNDDDLNVRFFHMKERFGASPQFPVSRYVDGLSKPTVPSRDGGHDPRGNYIGGEDCTNPLFAAALPDDASGELCHLPAGTRNKGLVFFSLIGGVPARLTNGGAPADTDWVKMVGRDPEAFDRTGIDPHMIQSITARAGLAPSSSKGDNGADPDNGREYDTKGVDLQYACTFALPTDSQRDCGSDPSCDCAGDKNPPLCTGTKQVRAKAYPTIRELEVAKGLGSQAVVSSICAVDADGRYTAAMNALGDRMKPVLAR